MKDKLGGKIIIEFIALRPKDYRDLINDCDGNKKKKKIRKSVS